MLLTKPGPFEVRNPNFIVLVGDPGIDKFYTNISCLGRHSQKVCVLPPHFNLVTPVVANSKNFAYLIIYLIWLGSLGAPGY